jgi:hypothetical protein
MTEAVLISHCGTELMTREQLAGLPVPVGTATHRPVPHHEIVNALIETLGFRHIGIVREQYAASPDGAKMFGVMDLEAGFTGCRFSLGLRNSHDKSMRLALTVGYRTLVCDNLAFHGDFTPILAKHSKNFSLVNAIAVGVESMQRNFKPMQEQVEGWRGNQITDDFAKLVIYRAFIEGELEIPTHLARDVHTQYFNPQIEDFAARTMFSLSNAFTGAFKELDPIPRFKATAKLGAFLGSN